MNFEMNKLKRNTKLKDNKWILWSFVGLAFVSFFYAGLKVNNKKWILCGIAHLIFVYIANSVMDVQHAGFIGKTIYFIVYIISITYLFGIKDDYQLAKHEIYKKNMQQNLLNRKEKLHEDSLKLWAEKFPEHSGDIESKYNVLNGILAIMLAGIDGTVDDKEIDFLKNSIQEILKLDEHSLEEFLIGLKSSFEKQVSFDDVSILQISLEDNCSNLKTIEMLSLLSAVNGFVDRVEFDFIKLVSYYFGIDLPEFEEFADALGVKCSDFKKDLAVEKAKHDGFSIVQKVVTGVGVFAATGVLAFLGANTKGENRSGSTNVKQNKRVPTAHKKEKLPMMMSSTMKKCVTCQCWGGPRQVATSRRSVGYSRNEDKGECVGGVFNKQQRAAVLSCEKWAKWSVLN